MTIEKYIGHRVIIANNSPMFGEVGTLIDVKPSQWLFGEKVAHVETKETFIIVPVKDIAIFLERG
jgi:hypothetical protein